MACSCSMAQRVCGRLKHDPAVWRPINPRFFELASLCHSGAKPTGATVRETPAGDAYSSASVEDIAG